MDEKNKKSLDKAIQNLPQYEPKASLWDAIDSGIEQSESDARLHQTIAKLPSYSPPETVWNNILQELDADALRKTTLIRQLNWMKYATAACLGFLMLFGANHLMQQRAAPIASNDIKVTIGYSKEMIPTSTVGFQDIKDDDQAFDIVQKACQRKMPICKTVQFSELRFELKDLEIAKQELNKNINDYDTDPTHKIQLARIERERSDILKRMVAMI